MNTVSFKFNEYCRGLNAEKLDNMSLYVKIAREFGGNYYFDRNIAMCDIIDFDTSEDLLRFKLQFT